MRASARPPCTAPADAPMIPPTNPPNTMPTRMMTIAAMTLGIAVQAPLVSDGKRPAAPRELAPAEVDDAEQHTIRLLRQEALLSRAAYPDRPSGTFGTQPA